MLDKPESLDPERSFGDVESKAIAVAITVTSQVAANRSIVMQTYLERDAPLGVFNTVLDKLAKASDRQEAKLQLESLQDELKKHESNLQRMIEDYQSIEARSEEQWVKRGKRGEHKLTDAERSQKSTAKTNIERWREEIKKIQVQIAKARGVIA